MTMIQSDCRDARPRRWQRLAAQCLIIAAAAAAPAHAELQCDLVQTLLAAGQLDAAEAQVLPNGQRGGGAAADPGADPQCALLIAEHLLADADTVAPSTAVLARARRAIRHAVEFADPQQHRFYLRILFHQVAYAPDPDPSLVQQLRIRDPSLAARAMKQRQTWHGQAPATEEPPDKAFRRTNPQLALGLEYLQRRQQDPDGNAEAVADQLDPALKRVVDELLRIDTESDLSALDENADYTTALINLQARFGAGYGLYVARQMEMRRAIKLGFRTDSIGARMRAVPLGDMVPRAGIVSAEGIESVKEIDGWLRSWGDIDEWWVLRLSELVRQNFTPAERVKDTYVTNVSFIDQDCLCPWDANEVSELVNRAVADGIERAVQVDPRLVYNAPGHKIENTGANVKRVIEIFMDLNQTPSQNHARLLQEVMEPANVDVIVSGTFLDKQNADDIRLSPMIITRINATPIFQHLDFDAQGLICRDPLYPVRQALCPNAHEDIALAVKELLESL